MRVFPCSGAWGPTYRGPMRSFKCVLLLFSLIFLLEHDLLALNLQVLFCAPRVHECIFVHPGAPGSHPGRTTFFFFV